MVQLKVEYLQLCYHMCRLAAYTGKRH